MRRCADQATLRALTLSICSALLLVGVARAAGVPRLDERRAVTESQAVIGQTPSDFRLLDRNGRPVQLAAYRGRPLLVSFIYTGCFTICPTQTRSLHDAVKGLDRMLGPHQFQVLSIGFNQPFDSPQALKAFAAQHRIDYQNWEFLSPRAQDVEAMTRAYGFNYVETPAGFDHIVGVTVVDAQGRIHGQVYGEKVTAEALGVPLRELILSAPPAGGAVFNFEELVDRVRILCTVYDPDTGEYRYNWRLLFEFIGGSAFFITAIVYLLRERRAAHRARKAPRVGVQQV